MTALTAEANPLTAATAGLGLPDRPELDTITLRPSAATIGAEPNAGPTPPPCRHHYIVDPETDVCPAAPYRHHHGRCKFCGYGRTFQYVYPAEKGVGEFNTPEKAIARSARGSRRSVEVRAARAAGVKVGQGRESAMSEVWKPVVGYEGWYEVSNLGLIRRVKATRCHPVCGEGLLRPVVDNHGYIQVTLRRDGRKATARVHRLVAEAFLGPCPPGCEVNHILDPKSDNRLTNLEYVTPSQNHIHAYALSYAHGQKGSSNGSAKLSESDVLAIRAARGQRAQADLAGEYGVTQSAISHVQRRKLWAWLPAAAIAQESRG